MSEIDRWDELKELLYEAAALSGQERVAFLTTKVRPELRDELESLLAALDEESGRFEQPAVARMDFDLEVSRPLAGVGEAEALVGQRLGQYDVVRLIGQGGMGAVYEGVRADDQFDKRVAIKLVRRELASDLTFARFRLERQILANLQHPGIATLLDGGVTEDGRPFLVMEYVEGESISEHCQNNRLSIDARVKLFRDVCDAVHVAHQNLIIHRDLKPANILVTEEGRPKLLDFGVAKLLRSPEAERDATLTTRGERLLTPSYSSPEQVRGEPMSTVSDVYSLGVVLYELLTGRRPFEVPSGSIAEMLDAVSTREPTKPSAAVADPLTHATSMEPTRAERRKLAGDLDNIVLMAIRKEAVRRYASAHDLSQDLGRYLDGRPVRARADTVSYRASKFLRRNRVLAAAAAAATLALGLGVAGTVVQAQRTSLAQARAVQRLQDIRELANSLLFEVHDAVADLPGATEARKLILERGFQNLEELAAQVDDPVVERELAEAYLRIGLVQGQPTGASLGDLDAARASYGRAIDIAVALVDAAPEDHQAQRTLALSHEKLGDVKAWTGEIAEGVAHAQVALGLYRDLAIAMPDSARHQFSVAISLVKLGDLSGHPVFSNLSQPDSSLRHYKHNFDKRFGGMIVEVHVIY